MAAACVVWAEDWSRSALLISPVGSGLIARPSIRASITASPVMPKGSNSSGAMRNSASNAPCARASSAASKATRFIASGLAIAATVRPKASR